MFNERGYAATSVEDVANAVGLLKGSLYHYIDSKEDLLFDIVEDVHGDVQAILDAAVARTELPPLERFAAYVEEQVEYNAHNIEKISVYYHEWLRLGGDRLAQVRSRRRRQEQMVVELLIQARDAGEIRADIDVKVAARCAFATIIWPYTWYRPGSISAARLAEFCVDFVLNGVSGGQPLPAQPS
jgi:AcrR family transcriptional regulator